MIWNKWTGKIITFNVQSLHSWEIHIIIKHGESNRTSGLWKLMRIPLVGKQRLTEQMNAKSFCAYSEGVTDNLTA